MKQFKEVSRLFLHKMTKTVGNNLGMKIIALVLSVALWAALISQDSSITREKVFTDVTIGVTGSDTLKRNGYIVTSNINEALSGFTVTSSVPQLLYDSVTIGNYNPRVELSKINKAGTQTLNVVSTSSTTYGSVTSVTPSTIEVEVEPFVTRYRIPVTVASEGNIAEGYTAGNITLDPPLVAVSGPASIVNNILRAEAKYDLTQVPEREGVARTAAPIVLLGRDGQYIESDLLSITSESVLVDSVVVEQNIYSIKEVPVSTSGLIKGVPANGYEVVEVSVSPKTVGVAGMSAVLNEMESIHPESVIDVTGQSASAATYMRLRKPGDVQSIDTEGVTVTVEIVPVQGMRTFQNVRINIVGLGNDLTAALNTRGQVVLHGPQNWLKQLSANSISLYVDAEGLTEGEHTLPVMLNVDGEQVDYRAEIHPETVALVIKQK